MFGSNSRLLRKSELEKEKKLITDREFGFNFFIF